MQLMYVLNPQTQETKMQLAVAEVEMVAVMGVNTRQHREACQHMGAGQEAAPASWCPPSGLRGHSRACLFLLSWVEVIKTQLDAALGSLLQLTYLDRRVGLDDLKRPLLCASAAPGLCRREQQPLPSL